ncbi:hypothetical protein Tco_1374703, partial [Tanacetum coccineum]
MQKDYDTLVQENRELRSQKDVASDKVKELQTELTDARVASIGLLGELSQTDAKLSDQALVVRDLQNQLVLERAKSQGYKDAVDGKLLDFVERGLRMRLSLKQLPKKFLVDFPTTPFPFLGKVVAAFG